MSHRIAIDARKAEDFGIGTYILNLVRQLGEIDRQNQYFLLVQPDGTLGDLPENFVCVQERSPVYSLREQWSVALRLRRLGIDLYHATHYVLPLFLTAKTIVTIHDIIHLLFPDLLPNRFAYYYARHMIRGSLSRSDRVITVSRNTKADLCDHFPVDGEKIEVIYNGVAPIFRQRLEEGELLRWLDRLDLRRPYLLFVGNPKPHKNLDNVIQAYARAREIAGLDAPLVCVGGREAKELKVGQRAYQLRVADHVRLLGHVAQEALPAIYQGASLFLYPTLYEGFGLPVVEAMAAGVPVITSNKSALREIGEGYAHLVDPLDVEEIARAIAHCMTSTEHRDSLRRLGLHRSRDFDWRYTAESTLALYREVLAQKSEASGVSR